MVAIKEEEEVARWRCRPEDLVPVALQGVEVGVGFWSPGQIVLLVASRRRRNKPVQPLSAEGLNESQCWYPQQLVRWSYVSCSRSPLPR